MRRNARVEIKEAPEVLNEIYNSISGKVDSASIFSNILRIDAYADTEGFQDSMNEITKRNLKYRYLEVREYTKAELEKAKLYDINIAYPWEYDIKHPEDYGTKYDTSNECPKCGLGKIQISDLIIDKKKMGKYSIAQIIPEVMVTQDLYNMILENKLTGCEFKPVQDYKGKEEPVLYQLIINNVLSPMNEEVRFEIDYTSYCEKHRAKGVFIRSEIVYNTSVLETAKDLNLSHEFIGDGNYCSRRVIVSAKFREVFKKNKFKGIHYFEPVSIKD